MLEDATLPILMYIIEVIRGLPNAITSSCKIVLEDFYLEELIEKLLIVLSEPIFSILFQILKIPVLANNPTLPSQTFKIYLKDNPFCKIVLDTMRDFSYYQCTISYVSTLYKFKLSF